MDDLRTTYRKFIYSRANQVLIDIFIFCLAFLVPFFIRFEGVPSAFSLNQMLILLPYVILARILCFAFFSVYMIIWRFVSVHDASTILTALFPPTMILIIGRLVLPDSLALFRVPLSVISMEFMFSLAGTLSIRMFWRVHCENLRRDRLTANGHSGRRAKTILIGAGAAGNMVAKEVKQRTDLGMDVVGFIDDDAKQHGKIIQGFRVLGTTTQIPVIANRWGVEDAIITIVNASSKEIRRISSICTEAGLKTRIVPGLFELLDEKITITKAREINIDDLLGRSVFQLEKHLEEVSSVYRGKRILVTGAGGSIGSELCRQLVAMGPLEIVLLDKDENSIFEIDNDLRARGSRGVTVHPVIANIMNADRLRVLFEKYQPQIVFHAAAHKHVPLMEYNVTEAILNNVMGTNNLIDTARLSGVERFIFISTDKAVNPTSVMGATKKIGEVIVQEVAKTNNTKFSCVRFGNVIGSRGSVIPFFQKQIARGGPVTVTHPEVRRYFMSIAEAVHLIIQAGTLGEKGEIFVLDMGQPIKITDMVKTLIKLSGHSEEDIEIKFIGMRPGEKLYEEILIDEERARATKFEKIFIAPATESLDGRTVGLKGIIQAAATGDRDKVIQFLSGMGIGFHREGH
jgi:FlaA1/EpsC-like NDP-sugar epimerase